ncbi:MAG: hypothetical protein Tsb005_19270 [Gammaproteobacteria bacterium]
MLILTRRKNERIILGENREIVAEILGIKGKKVRIGIYAPQNIRIERGEISSNQTPRTTNQEQEDVKHDSESTNANSI